MKGDKELESKYIIPPRLNTKFHLIGCTVPELLLIGFLLLLGLLAHSIPLLAVVAVIFAASIRFINGERNARELIIILWRYFGTPQTFSFITEEGLD